MSEPWGDPEVRAWLHRAQVDLMPMVKASVYSIGVISGAEPDAKQAVEVGFILLLGKPLILAVAPGSVVPPGLARAAEDIVEIDMLNPGGTRNRIAAAIERLEQRQAEEYEEEDQ